MSLPILILTPRGAQTAPYSADTLTEAAEYEPDGVYTLGRTYSRDHVLLFDQHMDRLEESARLENIPVRLDRPGIRRTLRTLIEGSPFEDVRYRVTIPRGAPDSAILTVAAFEDVPAAIRENGCKVILTETARHNPAAKTTAWMKDRAPTVQSMPAGVYEAILTHDEALLEGTSSNFYAIIDGVMHTADQGILSGIARRIVLEVAPAILPVVLTPVTTADLHSGRIDEVFLSSAGRGVVPIIGIDGYTIGNGIPGAFTNVIRAAYDQYVSAHIEPL